MERVSKKVWFTWKEYNAVPSTSVLVYHQATTFRSLV